MPNDLILAIPGVTVTATGVQLPVLSKDQWLDVGIRIGRIGSALQWIYGDWWVYGEDRKWGKTFGRAGGLLSSPPSGSTSGIGGAP